MISFLRRLWGEEADKASAALDEKYAELDQQSVELDGLLSKLQEMRESAEQRQEICQVRRIEFRRTTSGQMKAVKLDEFPEDETPTIPAKAPTG